MSMALRIDPENNEVHALKTMTDWRNQRVIEIGCGSGRLTRRLARLGAQIEAIDPDRKLIAAAKKDLPARLSERIRFRVGSVSNLNFPRQTFDIVVFSWVL
jgi:2-polyprenyl-3-methyl-5-hydroxy-6-metoxy-1,4-benzoquinol methylase